jgi:hypothetical protein
LKKEALRKKSKNLLVDITMLTEYNSKSAVET